jgi:predicted nuclease with RNAse H fold
MLGAWVNGLPRVEGQVCAAASCSPSCCKREDIIVLGSAAVAGKQPEFEETCPRAKVVGQDDDLTLPPSPTLRCCDLAAMKHAEYQSMPIAVPLEYCAQVPG